MSFRSARLGERRRFLRTAARALLVAAGSSWIPGALAQTGPLGVSAGRSATKIRGFPFDSLDSYLTPTSRFFLRSHLEIPRLDPGGFRVQIGGWVERPFSLSLAELSRIPAESCTATFECSGNGVAGGFVSTAEWTGPLLAPLLERARVRSGAMELLMEGADAGLDEHVPVPVQYARSVPLSTVGRIPAVLAMKMNGEPLLPEHGYPLRAVLPGQYSLQNVKWLVRITVLPKPYRGFYETQRYVEMRRLPDGIRVQEIEKMRIKSQIARIVPRSEAGQGAYRITGAAWSGGDGVRQVEVSMDGGRSWRPAALGESRGSYAWTLWSYDWSGARPGVYEVMARATDGLGRSQPITRDSRVLTGYVNNWCESKRLTVPA